MADRETRQGRQRCRVCGQLKPLSEFGMHNRRRRRQCWTCRTVRTFRTKEKAYRRQIKRCILEWARLIRKGRPNGSRAAGIFGQLTQLCGSPDRATDAFVDFINECLQKKRGTFRGLKALVTLCEMLRLANQEQTAPVAPPVRKRARKHRRRERLFDPTAMTDAQLDAAIEQYQAIHSRRKRFPPRRGPGRPPRVGQTPSQAFEAT